jgi:DNA polymerase-3 subunit delta'
VKRLSELVNQADAVAFLRHSIRQGRFANAYLLHGPAGVGKGTAAIGFARAILCERAGPAGHDTNSDLASTEKPTVDEACERCSACLKTARLQHPDLKFLFPVSGEERELDATIAETLDAWRDDPLFVFSYEKAASIRLSMTRELLRELGLRPFESTRRVVVVRDADRMREDQYSAMLKAIEEPAASTVWVLTSSRPSRLPATIRSRCQLVRFAPLSEIEIATFLEQRAGVPANRSRLVAAMACGSLARALTLRDSEPLQIRNEALALLAPALRGDRIALWKAVQSFNRFGRAGRESLRRLIEIQEIWLRDILRARYGAASDTLVNRDQEVEIRRHAKAVDASEIRRRLLVLEDALQAIEGNVTPDLALFSAMERIADPALESSSWPPPATARWQY